MKKKFSRLFMKSFFVFFLVFVSNLSAQISTSELLKGEWRFNKKAVESAMPDDSGWAIVTIPHTWNIADGQSGAGTDEWQNNGYYRGPGTYTNRFNFSGCLLKKRIYIRFEAVSQVAEVFFNGKRLGEHKGAFNAFIFDITDVLKKGENFLVVKANNAWDKNIAPLGGDFTMFGGIYRPVWLLTKNEVSISPLDFASCGVYLKQTKQSDSEYGIDASSKIRNSTSKPEMVKVSITLFAPDGRKIKESITQQIVGKQTVRTLSQKINIQNPILWQGVENPSLYRAYVQVYKGKTLVDTLSQFIGFRTFKIDSIQGAFLNGKPYKIRGVNRHQDRQSMGWAVSNRQHEEDMALIKEIGANGVRLAHYPHCEYTYTLCDRMGFLVWAEIPLVNNITGSSEFAENAKLQLTEMIRQNFNHPSIVFWSIYNEMGHRPTDDPHKLLTELNTLANTEDPTRYTVAAANRQARPEKSIPNVLAFNSYPGWYSGKPEDMGKTLVGWNQSVANKGVGVSEYGAGASIYQHEQGMTKAPEPKGLWHPEEWQAIVHETNYQYINKYPWVWGSFVWNMFDFASAGRVEGDTVGTNDKGLVTYNRQIRKDAFYFYKANWNPDPMVYITSRRHAVRDTAYTDVKVYSNCTDLHLFINEMDMGATVGANGIFVWKDRLLKKGDNLIKVIAKKDGKILIDRCVWEYKSK